MAFPIQSLETVSLLTTPSMPTESLLATFAPLTPLFEAPEICVHQAPDVFALWKAWEKESPQIQDIPYWAHVWPAARLLVEFMTTHAEIFSNKIVVDIGSGCGATGLAALKVGCKEITVNDIDPIAMWMAEKNYHANSFFTQGQINFVTGNLLQNLPDPKTEIILVADLFYDKTTSQKLLNWLILAKMQDTLVYIADAGRPFTPKENVRVVIEKKYLTNIELEGRSERTVKILELLI